MTSFEFVFGMISVITSLALTRLLIGCVELYRHAEHVRFCWRHACWVAVAFMLLVGNWAGLWKLHAIQAWHAFDVINPLVFVGVLYAFCDLVMPEEPKEGQVLDLRDYHAQQGRRYKTMHLAFATLALLVIAQRASGFDDWLAASSFALVAATCTVVALPKPGSESTFPDTTTRHPLIGTSCNHGHPGGTYSRHGAPCHVRSAPTFPASPNTSCNAATTANRVSSRTRTTSATAPLCAKWHCARAARYMLTC